jgi:lysophospholipase L1-like esterase
MRNRCLSAAAFIAAALTYGSGVAYAQPKAVAIGDSFIAGNAARWNGNSTNEQPGHYGTDRGAGVYEDTTCYRSDVAEINSATLPGLEPVNLACSGATTTTVINNQLPRLVDLLDQGEEVRLIVVLVGGNNLGFTNIVTSCLFAYVGDGMGGQGPPCNPQQEELLHQRLPSMQADVEAVIRNIQQTMEGQPPYRLIVQTYPSPIPAGSDNRYPQGNGTQADPRVSEGGCPFYNSDSNWARRHAVPEIAAALRAAAVNTGVEFLDNQDALTGREICARTTTLVGEEGPDPTTADWVRWANLLHIQGDFSALVHPNAYAQRAFGTCLTLVWSESPGNYACRNTPGGDYTQMYLAQPPPPPPPHPSRPLGGDTAPPDTRITAGPKAKTKKKSASFGFASTEPGSTFECSLDGHALRGGAGAYGPCASPLALKAKKGRHAFSVRAKDAAGNVDPTPATYSWRVRKKR